MFVIVLAVYALLSVGGLTLFKLGAQKVMSIGITGSAFSMQISWLSLTGLLMYVCSFLIYMGLVSKMQLSYMMPIVTGVVYVLTMIVSLLVFHEPFTILKAIGVLLILTGVIIMNINK